MNSDPQPGKKQDDGNPQAVVASPGERLREQRESQALSVQQVANELHLTMHFLRALEADAYDKLPGDVFARGYLRSYANLLQLDAEQMMHDFDDYVGRREPRPVAPRRRDGRKRRRRNLRLLLLGLLVLVGLAAALWYSQRASAESEFATEPAALSAVKSYGE